MVVLLTGVLALIVVVLIATRLAARKGNSADDEPVLLPDADCCGAHEVCEAESLMNHTNRPVYFDDEELDRFANKDIHSFTEAEIKEFEDILYTLRDSEVSGWLKSLQLRNIDLPLPVREEALMIVSERRFGK